MTLTLRKEYTKVNKTEYIKSLIQNTGGTESNNFDAAVLMRKFLVNRKTWELERHKVVFFLHVTYSFVEWAVVLFLNASHSHQRCLAAPFRHIC